MQKNIKKILLICFGVCAFGVHLQSFATPYTPNNGDDVVATWQVLDNKKDVINLEIVREFIEQGQYPGESDYRYGHAKTWLQSQLTQDKKVSVELLYLYARVLQHQHQFDSALKYLDEALALDPRDTNSWLLKSNIHMVQGDADLAKRACLAMLGHTSITVLTACALDVASQDGQLDKSYKQLNRLSNSQDLAKSPEQQWIVHMLADMALRNDMPVAAEKHLASFDLETASVSILALWADTQLTLLQYDQVLTRLAPIVNAHPIKDDALLLRLTIAEKAYSKLPYWQNIFAQRVALRELRKDSLHAAELARYYLEVNINPEKALYWAQINWQVAQQHGDRKLLDQANNLWQTTQDL
jgi:tetratricopeptide (TPR) repeat protein